MKKKLFLGMLLFCTLFAFVGCSTNEITMLKTLEEMFEIETGTIVGGFTIKQPELIETEFEGEFNLENPNRPYLNLKVDLDVNTSYSKKVISGIVILDKDTLIVSKNLVRKMKELEENKEYLNLFDQTFKDYEYFSFHNDQISDIIESFYHLKTNLSTTNIKEVARTLKDLKSFKMVHMEEDDMIEFTITPNKIEQGAEILVDYLLNNQKELAFETESVITKNIFSNIMKSAEDFEYLNTIFKKTYETDEDFNAEIKRFVRKYNSYYNSKLEENSKQFSDSYFTYVFGYDKYRKLFDNTVSFKLYNRKEKINVSFIADFTIKERKISQSIIDNDLIIEYYEIDVEKENNIPNTVNISWTNASNLAKIYTHYKKYDRTKEYNSNYYLIENRIYLPLRQICELFSLEVSWNEIEKKAYVKKGNQQVDMTGIIMGDRTFIKIRDFEKLDFIVSYIENGENKIATIKRP